MDDMEKEKKEFLVIAGSGNGRGARGGTRNPAPRQLSNTVKQINQKAQQWLKSRVEEVFAQVDDSLFSMAEKAHQQDEQDGLFQAIRVLRVELSQLVDSFCDGIEERFYEPRNDSPGEDASLNAASSLKSLSLVKDDDLEQQVVIRTMIANIKRDHAEAIAALSLRLDNVLPSKIYDENVPLGPASVCGAFADALDEVEISLRARMTVFKKFEAQLVNRLGELYQLCNTALIEMGVLPTLEDPLGHRRRPGGTMAARGQASGQPPVSGNAPVPAGDAMAGAMGAGYMGGGAAMASSVSGAGGTGGQFAPGLMPYDSGAVPMATPSLLQHLGQLQMGVPLQAGATGELVDVTAMLQQRLVEAKQSASLHELDSEVIRLVDMLFSFMLEDRNLAEPIKVQLIRLQLPMLKLAVADKAFFSKGGHPARRLLNELADAAIGWQPGENYLNDPLYREVCSVVEGVLSEFEEDESVFVRLLESFRDYASRERKRAAVMERRTIDEAQGTARVEAAKARVAAVFDALTAERELPKIVHEWLNRVWNSVLFRTCLKEGTDSGNWRLHVLTARDLIWSVVAPMPESRAKMQRLLPDLRRRLDEGAQSLSLSPGDRQRLMGGLNVLYRERESLAERVESERERRIRERLVQELRREADSILAIPEVEETVAEVVALAEEPRELPANQPALPDVESLQEVAKVATLVKSDSAAKQSVPMDDEHWQQTYHLKDSWFLLRQPEKLPVRCRLAAIIKDLDQFMFVNRSGAKVAVYSRLELAQSLRDEVLLPLEQGPLFERALEYVVGNCGESKIAISV
ncbi:DUF1631 domain-containing protein [Microbulbifer aggregans]|uniref:DUF1631 domain-containing protein n=1 Tax=Microbulbifer aggregans TaxID=1769779 RepID=UPI001CFCF431|nr:DUF1631 domain-containing protein [Microbulbifer aggregans]